MKDKPGTGNDTGKKENFPGRRDRERLWFLSTGYVGAVGRSWILIYISLSVELVSSCAWFVTMKTLV